ncbi:MAG: SGNH/GDSL hydrolase family protein [Limisphaerales bacterium]
MFVVIMAAVLGYYEFVFRLPMGSGPAGPSLNPSPYRKVWLNREVFVVGLGDSVTAGFGAAKGHSYFDRIIQTPADDFADTRDLCLAKVFPKLKATNFAISGSTSFDSIRTELRKVPVQSSNVLGIVIVTTGGNDLIHNYGRTLPREGAMYGATMAQSKTWVTNFAVRLDTIRSLVAKAFPGGYKIFIGNIYDPTDGVGDPQRVGLPKWPDNQALVSAYNDVLENFARERNNAVHLINIHDLFLGHGIHCREFWRKSYRSDDPTYWYHENLEDPNERGYDALRRLYLNALAEEFGK